jgi:RNase P subunit RPR2
VKLDCKMCDRFPVPTGNFLEIATSEQRHSILYKCKKCGNYIEIVLEEKGHRFLKTSEVEMYYPDVEFCEN